MKTNNRIISHYHQPLLSTRKNEDHVDRGGRKALWGTTSKLAPCSFQSSATSKTNKQTNGLLCAFLLCVQQWSNSQHWKHCADPAWQLGHANHLAVASVMLDGPAGTEIDGFVCKHQWGSLHVSQCAVASVRFFQLTVKKVHNKIISYLGS